MVGRGSMHVLPDSAWSWVICFGNSLALFSSLGVYRCFGVFYDSVMSEFDVKYAQVSLVSGFFTGAMSFGALFLIVAKWLGLRKVGLASTFLFSLSLFIASQSTSIEMFVIFCGGVTGFFAGISINLVFLGISIYYEKHRSKAAGLISSGVSVGVLVAAPALSAIIGEYGWRRAMLITSAVTLHACVGTALYRPVASVDVEENPVAADDRVLAESPASDDNPCSIRIKAVFDYTLFSRVVYILAYVANMTYWAAMVGTTFLIIPLGMESWGWDRTAATILLTCQSAGDLAGRIFVGLIGDCKGVNTSLLLGVTATLATFVTYGITLSRDYVVQCVVACILGITYAPFGSLHVVLYTEVFGVENMAHALSYEGFLSTIFTLPVTYLLGIMIDLTGEVRIAYYVCGVLMGLAAISVSFIYILQRNSEPTRSSVREVATQSSKDC